MVMCNECVGLVVKVVMFEVVVNRRERVAFVCLVCLLVMVVGNVHYRVTQHCWLVWLAGQEGWK